MRCFSGIECKENASIKAFKLCVIATSSFVDEKSQRKKSLKGAFLAQNGGKSSSISSELHSLSLD